MQHRQRLSLSLACLLAAGPSAALAQGAGSWIDPPAQAAPPATPERRDPPAAEPAPAPRPTPSQARTPILSPPENRRAEPTRRDPAQRPPAAAPRREAAERVAPQPSAEPLRRPVRPEAPAGTVERRAPERDRSASRVAAAEALATEYLNTWSAPNRLTLDSTTSFYGRRVTFHGRVMTPGDLLEEKRRFVRRWPEREYQPRLSTMGTACSPQGRSCTVRSVFDFAAANPAEGRRTQGVGTLELVVSFAEGRPVIVAENSIVHGRSGRRSALRETRDE